MQVVYSSSIKYFPPSIATVGFFDGVHAGHRFLIEELKNIAAEQKLNSMVITFSNHPRALLQPDFPPRFITTLEEKIKQLESTGIDSCVVLDFTQLIAQLSAYDFLKTILWEQLNVKSLLVGHDHRFGHNRTDGFPEYIQYGRTIGMRVAQASYFSDSNETRISSSTIRKSLDVGDVELAHRLLTYHYSIKGKVVGGFKVGQKIGFPTANIQVDNIEKIIPYIGVYAVKVHWNEQIYKGMMNIGNRPTLNNGSSISLEVHIFDFEQDIYDQIVEIDFVCRIRDEKKFRSIDELIEQLQKDKTNVLNCF